MRYRIREGIAGPDVPHDLVHLVVERETGEDGGFWGAVAAGAVFGSMEHVEGRRPPHARRRSDRALAERGDRLLRAELMAGLVGHVAGHNVTDARRVRVLAREVLATLPDTSVDAERVIRAGRALRDVSRRWGALETGEELTLDWPDERGGRGRPKGR